jgi:seryl-tRNA synthetase
VTILPPIVLAFLISDSANKRMPKDEDDPDYQLISRGKNLTDSISIFEITTKKMVFSTRKCVEVNNLIATQAQRKLEREILTKLEMGRIKECLGSIRVELEEIRNDFIDAMWQFSDLLAQMTPQSDESEATKELQELQNLEMEQQEEIKELTNHKRILLRELKSAREK